MTERVRGLELDRRGRARRRWLTLMGGFAMASAALPAAALAREIAPHPLLAQAASGANPPNAFAALVALAKAEGEVTLYSSATENVARRVATAFTEKYGVKVQFLRLAGTALLQRYATEAEAGNFAADILFGAGNTGRFASEAVQKGWLEAIAQAGLPVVTSGEFPAKYMRQVTALVQIAPWLITFNTDRVKGADVPKDWLDILDPKFRGQILLPDPRASDSYIDFWSLLLDKYGESFFDRMRAQMPRQFTSGVPAVQALGAGEGAFELPAVPAQVQAIQVRGAPLGMVQPPHTTGVEMQVFVTHRAKAKHPNAARLLANYVMSKEGNQVFNDDPGSVSVYDESRLPAQYESPNDNTMARKDQIIKLLGFQ